MTSASEAPSRWSRPRLVASWLIWLAVYLLMFRPAPSMLPLILLNLAAIIRPSPLKDATDYQRLRGAVAVLIAVPLTAVLLASESAFEFLCTTPGIALLIAVWMSSVFSDFRFYRSLPRFATSSDAPQIN